MTLEYELEVFCFVIMLIWTHLDCGVNTMSSSCAAVSERRSHNHYPQFSILLLSVLELNLCKISPVWQGSVPWFPLVFKDAVWNSLRGLHMQIW